MDTLNKQQYMKRFDAIKEKTRDYGSALLFKVFETTDSMPSRVEEHKNACVSLVSSLEVYRGTLASVDTEKIRGVEINPGKFMGPYFDFEREVVILKNEPRQKGADPFAYYDRNGNVTRTVAPTNPTNLYKGEGFVYALTDPPYGLRATTNQIAELVHDFYQDVFNRFQNTIIYEWNTDWSDYFDDGHEWWGSFMWTVELVDQKIIIAIAGSTTD